MKPTEQLFTAIARKHLFIETLETQNSDRLDFHDVSVRGVQSARDLLQAAEWEAQPVAATGNKPYSVLLLYPDYLDDTGCETYYAFVEAIDPIDAIAVAQREAVTEQVIAIDDPTDFIPLLVTEGHHCGQPLFNT